MRDRRPLSVVVFFLAVGVIAAPSAGAQEVLWIDRVPKGSGLAIDVSGGQVSVAGVANETAQVRTYGLDGELLWARAVGRTALDEVYGLDAGPTGVYVAGNTYGAFPGQRDGHGRDAFVARYAPDGRLLWVRTIVGRMRTPIRDCRGEDMVCGDSEEAFDVAAHGGSVYVVGRSDTRIHGSTPRQRGFVRAYDIDGGLLWTRVFREEGWNVDATATDVYVASFGMPQLRRFRSDGTLVWTRRPGGDVEWDDVYAHGSSIFVAGDTYASGDGVVARLDRDGRILWSSTPAVPGWNGFNRLVVRSGEVFAVGWVQGRRLPDQPLAGGDFDVLVAVLGHDGEVRSLTQVGGPRSEQGRGIAVARRSVFVTSGTSGPFLDLPPVGRSMLILGLRP